MLNDKERHFVHISDGGDGGMSVTTQAVSESLWIKVGYDLVNDNYREQSISICECVGQSINWSLLIIPSCTCRKEDQRSA